MLPPTIAHLNGHGLVGLFVICDNPHCLHAAPFTFAALGLPDELPFPTIGRRRRFVCTHCGGRRVSVSPTGARIGRMGRDSGRNEKAPPLQGKGA